MDIYVSHLYYLLNYLCFLLIFVLTNNTDQFIMLKKLTQYKKTHKKNVYKMIVYTIRRVL